MRKTWGMRTKRKVGVRNAKEIGVRAEKNGEMTISKGMSTALIWRTLPMTGSVAGSLLQGLTASGDAQLLSAQNSDTRAFRARLSNLQAPSHRADLQLCIKADNCNYY